MIDTTFTIPAKLPAAFRYPLLAEHNQYKGVMLLIVQASLQNMIHPYVGIVVHIESNQKCNFGIGEAFPIQETGFTPCEKGTKVILIQR